MRRLRQRGKNIGLLVPPAALLAGVGNTSRTAFQNPNAPSPTASTGARMPRQRQSRSRIGPGFGGFPEAIGERDELLAAIGTDPIITSKHDFSWSRRTFRWIPSTHRYT